jgi:para-aminobenzoate synthetase component 1
MPPLIQEIATAHTPESLVEQLRGEPGLVLLRSGLFDFPEARYSFVAVRPFLTFRSFGSRCEIRPCNSESYVQFGNPWHLLDALMARYELLDEIDLPFPLGGCFGFWGYDLKNFVEPKLRRRAVNDLELPDCHIGFYDSLAVFDHRLGKTCIVSTGLSEDGSRSEKRMREAIAFWSDRLTAPPAEGNPASRIQNPESSITSTLSRADFVEAVERAQAYIRSGDIYQVNLSHRLTAHLPWWSERPREFGESDAASTREDARATRLASWMFFEKLTAVSPAPFAAFVDCDEFQVASSSPEQFLRLSGHHIQTRPIKGTRPRSADPTRDAQLTYELQTSAKEMAELVMITDLLRNDLGKVCEFGSVQVPELVRLERYPQVQHLVSTVDGRLRADMTHFAALASCFPGGSITGAPKIRAMEIIDELEPVSRGPYTGALGYLGFNRESQLSITIRTAICKDGLAHFNVGAGIVADSQPEAEYEETLAKARGFTAAVQSHSVPLSDPFASESPPRR